MPINRTTYSGAFLKSVRPFAVKVTEGLIRDIVVAGNMQREECTLSRCRLTWLLTSNWRPLNIYRQEGRRRLIQFVYLFSEELAYIESRNIRKFNFSTPWNTTNIVFSLITICPMLNLFEITQSNLGNDEENRKRNREQLLSQQN